jgi:hypothetical protein
VEWLKFSTTPPAFAGPVKTSPVDTEPNATIKVDGPACLSDGTTKGGISAWLQETLSDATEADDTTVAQWRDVTDAELHAKLDAEADDTTQLDHTREHDGTTGSHSNTDVDGTTQPGATATSGRKADAASLSGGGSEGESNGSKKSCMSEGDTFHATEGDTFHATEHRHDSVDEDFVSTDNDSVDEEDDSHREPLYISVGLLLNNDNFKYWEIEQIIKEVIWEVEYLQSSQIVDTFEAIFYPFFFAPRAHCIWRPKDPTQMINNLRWYDWFRQEILTKYYLPQNKMLTPYEFTQVLSLHLSWFRKHDLKADQKSQKIESYISAAMHNDCGSRLAVYAAWQMGIPYATYGDLSTGNMLTTDAGRLEITNNVRKCIRWLQCMSDDIKKRKTTPTYLVGKMKARLPEMRHEENAGRNYYR